MVLDFFGFWGSWVMPQKINKNHLVGKACLIDKAVARNATPLCLKWTIWRERNNRTFNGVKMSLLELKSSFLMSLHEHMQ